MKNTINQILAVCVGLILIGCNSEGSSNGMQPANPSVNISLSSVDNIDSGTLSTNSEVNISLSSGSGTANVPTNVALTLNFNEVVTGVSPTTVLVESGATSVITALPTQSGNSYTFNLSGLTNATTYNVSLTNGITSLATGLPIVANPFSFTTAELGIPTVQVLNPINGSTEVALNPTVTLQFSEPVTGVSPTTLTWTSSSGNAIPFAIIESGPTYMLRLGAGVSLNLNTLYNVKVKNGITGTVNINAVRSTTFNFTTFTRPTVSLTSPNPTTKVSLNPTITLAFNEAVSGVNTNTIQFEINGGQPQPITITQSGNSYTLTPSQSLLLGIQYVMLVNSGISSVTTGISVLPTTFNFTTAAVRGYLTSIGTVATIGQGPCAISISPDGKYVYVANYNDNTLSQYSRDASGILTALGIPIIQSGGSNPVGIIVSSDGANVYVINQGNNTITQFSRDSGTGLLTAIGTPVAAYIANANGITISPDGKNVYVTLDGNDTLGQYNRSSSGILTAIGTFETGPNPRGIIISPDGANVYVTNNQNNTVSPFNRGSGGALTALDKIQSGGSNPWGIIISSDSKNVYVINQGNQSLTQFSRGAGGILTAIGTPIPGLNNPFGVNITPDGNNVYVTNNGSNTVSQYSRDSGTGLLTSIGTVATGVTPVGIIVSPDGKNVYVANSGSNTVSQYSIYSLSNISNGHWRGN